MYCFSLYFFTLLVVSNGHNVLNQNQVQLPQDCGTTRFGNTIPDSFDTNEARLGEFPWMARIGMMDPISKDILFYCSGSLIHPKLVVSAAHCGDSGQIVRVGENVLGTKKDSDDGKHVTTHQDVEIDIIRFADYCRLSKVNDISVILLKKPVTLNEFVQPICLGSQHEFLNTTMTLSGWGTVYSGFGVPRSKQFEPTNRLMYAHPIKLDSRECDSIHVRGVQEYEICIGYNQRGAKSCVADSGSPLITFKQENGVRRAHLLGVASHDLFNCRSSPTSPIVYTSVSYFADYLLDVAQYEISKRQEQTEPI